MADEKRITVHEKLVEILGNDRVYFQPPENLKLVYPCMVYSRRTGDGFHADDRIYRYSQSYDLTYISRDPDDGVVRKVMEEFPGIRYDRHFTSDNLHHDTFFIRDIS